MTEEKEKEKENNSRINFHSSIEKLENDLEHKITYISAGALALSITFIEKIVDLKSANFFWLLILGWFLLVITLSINLISTFVSRKMTMKSLDEFDSKINEIDLINNIKNRNKNIIYLDFISLITLLCGILLIVIFCSVNLENNQSLEINNNKNKSEMAEKDIIEKGRMIPTPKPSTESGNSDGSGNSSGSGNNSGSTSGNSSSEKK
jgi:uncharacterized membrane protein YgcG